MHMLQKWLMKQFSLFIGSIGVCAYRFVMTPNTHPVAA